MLGIKCSRNFLEKVAVLRQDRKQRLQLGKFYKPTANLTGCLKEIIKASGESLTIASGIVDLVNCCLKLLDLAERLVNFLALFALLDGHVKYVGNTSKRILGFVQCLAYLPVLYIFGSLFSELGGSIRYFIVFVDFFGIG